jgi:Domain of unknown function (DUF1996)
VVDRIRTRRAGFAVPAAAAVALVALALLAVQLRFPGHHGPVRGDYVSIGDVPPQPPTTSSGGVFTSECGRNDSDRHNSDNLITLPHQPGAAQHVHEYVGNQAVDADSTDAELAVAPTSCSNGDQSAYFWTVLRDTRSVTESAGDLWDGGAHNAGIRLLADRVTIEYRGSRAGGVVAMPRFLRMLAGNARATTRPVAGVASAQWSCSGNPDRRTQLYPLCPAGQQVVRTYDFPSCWDGLHLDSPNHRTHVSYPTADGSCPHNTFRIPQLRVQVAYTVPPGRSYAIDSFPDQHRSPLADHAEFVNVMPEELMARATGCINIGARC